LADFFSLTKGSAEMRKSIALLLVLAMTTIFDCAEASRPVTYTLPPGEVSLNSRDRNDLFFYGSKLCETGKYALALEYFKRAIVVQNSFDDVARIGEAECLWHLNQQAEALSIFEEVQHRDPLCDYASLKKVAVLMQSARYNEALDTCDFLENHSVFGPEKACILRSRIYEQQNRIMESRQQAQRAYYHCEHLGLPTAAAEARLRELNCAPVYVVNTDKNDAVFSMINNLAAIKPNVDRVDFQRLFGRIFQVQVKDNQGYYLSSIKSISLFPNVQLWSADDRCPAQIVVMLNTDLCSITQEEIEAKFGLHYDSAGTTVDNAPENGTREICYRRSADSITFSFEPRGSQCLRCVRLELF
jgi:tetratricopeptide (TPR) repeat protein